MKIKVGDIGVLCDGRTVIKIIDTIEVSDFNDKSIEFIGVCIVGKYDGSYWEWQVGEKDQWRENGYWKNDKKTEYAIDKIITEEENPEYFL